MLNTRQIGFGSKDYTQTLELRDRVLRIPLGMKLTDQETARDREDSLFAGFLNDQIVGCFIFTKLSSTTLKMRQVAVDERHQGQNIGAQMMAFAENWARDNGYKEIVLSGRESISGFYERLGYSKEGDIFVEVGIPHIKMKKLL